MQGQSVRTQGASHRGPRAHVLLIDDDDLCRTLYESVLLRRGFAVTATSSGKDALVQCALQSFDAIVCDVFMPELDGIEVLRHLVDRPGHPPVVMMSSGGTSGYDQVLQAAVMLGAAGGLTKPFAPQRLIQEVDRVLQAPAAAARV